MSLSKRGAILAGTVVCTVAATVLSTAPALAVAAPLADRTTLVRVTAAGTDASSGWIEQAYDCTDPNGPFTDPSQAFVPGPGKPALGSGSHVMTTGQYSGQTELFRTAQFDGTLASAIEHISYATFAASTKASDTTLKQPAYLRLSFDTDGDVADGPEQTLYYEPAINHGSDIADGVWQNWDASTEEWSTDGSPDSLTTLQAFAASHPTAVISNAANGGGVAFVAGCAGGNQTNGTFGVDRFAITTDQVSDLFDFDPAAAPAVRDVRVTSTQGGWNAAAYNVVDDLATPQPQQGMAFGPGQPPAGIGSHVIHYGNNTNVVELWRSTQLDGVNVGDIRTLNYSTYDKPSSTAPVAPQQPAYLRLSVSTNGDGVGDAVLYFEPAFEHSAQIKDNTWQTWDAADALWSTDGSPDNLTTLAAFAAAHPKATVITPQGAVGKGGLAVIVGCQCDDQRNADFYVDELQAGYFHDATPESLVRFDFEPVVPAPTISVPSTVVGKSVVNVAGRAVPNSPVALYQKTYPATGYTKVATTTASATGAYLFHRTVSKATTFYVRDYDRTNSVARTVRVRLAVALSLRTITGKLMMTGAISPAYSGVKVRFWRVNRNGTHTLLAERVTSRGVARARVSAPSGHRITVVATAIAPAGNLSGRSTNRTIRVA